MNNWISVEQYRKLAMTIVLCDSTDLNNPKMIGDLYKQSLEIIGDVDSEIHRQGLDE